MCIKKVAAKKRRAPKFKGFIVMVKGHLDGESLFDLVIHAKATYD